MNIEDVAMVHNSVSFNQILFVWALKIISTCSVMQEDVAHLWRNENI